MNEENKCISCGESILVTKYFSRFKCPNCLETIIVRCHKCKSNSVEYVCPKCGFKGP